MKNRLRARRGFTMIEMVIALAIAVVMVVAVHSVTAAMSGFAQRQQALSKEEARWLRLEELLRQDLRGWRVDRNRQTRRTEQAANVLLDLETTCDALFPGEGAGEPKRTSKIQYMVREVAGQFELVRVEAGVETPLVRSGQRPLREFLLSGEWTEKETSTGRKPEAVRISVGERVIVIGL